MILRVGGFFAFSGTVYIATLTKWINLCKRDKALAHFERGYRSGYDGQKRKNEESFNHFKCITRYYIYTDIQWKGVGCVLSDDKLVEQILLGNENAAEELIKRYYTSILRYCRWHCSNLEKAEDLTQETFLKLFKNLSGYKGKKKFKAYLYTIANHLCIDESRKVEFYPLEDEENIVHEYNDIVRLEDRAEISYFLKFLSSEQREAVILRFGEQLSFGEIAKVMGCNMRTAQSRVRNALKIMRKEQENER